MTCQTRFWRPDGLSGAEFVFASYARHAFPRHFYDEYLIAAMVRGVERVRHAQGADLAPAGSLVLLNPGQVHENGAVDDKGFAYRTVYLPPRLFEQCLDEAGVAATPAPPLPGVLARDRRAFAPLLDLHREVEAGEPPLRLQTLLLVGVCAGVRRLCGVPPAGEQARPSARQIAHVREYLNAHFAEGVSLHDLGRLVGLSVFHLARAFRDQVGLPPCQYQLHRRVRHALTRLRARVPIVAAACEAGFTDQSYLTRHFERILGVTPGQFRANRKNVQDAPPE